jgi:hypothetical protein
MTSTLHLKAQYAKQTAYLILRRKSPLEFWKIFINFKNGLEYLDKGVIYPWHKSGCKGVNMVRIIG